MGSNAVGSEIISRTVGYEIEAGDFRESSPNLPQNVTIFGEANHANQADIAFDTAIDITSAQEAGELFGYGSPIYTMMNVMRPPTSTGMGGIPTTVFIQAEPGGAAAKILTITPVGVANNNGTHYLVIAGRKGIFAEFYALNINAGDHVADINQKIEDAINAVLGCPMSCVSSDYTSVLTSKWRGKTADEITVTIDTGADDLGLTYNVVSTQLGNGTPSIAASLDALGDEWYTQLVNSYGAVSTIMDALEQWNGVPKIGSNAPTGRFVGTIFKPLHALTGSTLEDPSSITDSRKGQVTIVICSAPLSKGFSFEAAANYSLMSARLAQDTPHLDIGGMQLPDMPTPTAIGVMSKLVNRNAIVKKGCTTVKLNAGKYEVQDFVTTYHPVGENPPAYRYVRNMVVDDNYRYGYYLREQIHVVDHVIANDGDTVDAEKVVKPKDWIQELSDYADDCTSRALIVQPDFTKASTKVGISTSNPDRFETTQSYKRSGIARIASTTVTAGFNFGTN